MPRISAATTGCECFTADPSLPAAFPRVTTADYNDAGAIAGFEIDRGHLVRPLDRTSGSLDNARTFYFDNVVPQAADLNQGPWAALENDLGDLAAVQDREVYIIAGAFGNRGTLRNEGKVVIPTHTWKVALILPRNQGLANVRDYRDVEAIAVIMPNDPGIRNVPWQDYQATVDDVGGASGYDLLALLPDDVEDAVESNTQPPLATAAGPVNPVPKAARRRSRPRDRSIPTARSRASPGTSAMAAAEPVRRRPHVYAQDGSYTARLTITDSDGLTDTATVVVNVTNVVPVAGAVPERQRERRRRVYAVRLVYRSGCGCVDGDGELG